MGEIKLYQKRKFYDTKRREHTDLEKLFKRLRAGEDIRVFTAKEKEDVTYNTFLRILINHGRRAGKSIPTELLFKIIRSGNGTFTDYIQKAEKDWPEKDKRGIY